MVLTMGINSITEANQECIHSVGALDFDRAIVEAIGDEQAFIAKALENINPKALSNAIRKMDNVINNLSKETREMNLDMQDPLSY